MGVNTKRVIITGVTGQDGSYLAEIFLNFGYEVHGLVRRASSFNTFRIDHLINKGPNNFYLHYGDLTDSFSVINLVSMLKPFAIINMAAQSHVQISFDMPEYTFACNTQGVLNFLEAIRIHSPETIFYQASTSELFGNGPSPQSLKTKFFPESPYAVSKLNAHELVRLWREAYNLKACSGILFNHESYRRGPNFVTKKIVVNAKRIKLSIQSGKIEKEIEKLRLGNMKSVRDWGFAPEYILGIFQFIHNPKQHTLLIGTGKSTTVENFCDRVFSNFNLNWKDWVIHDNHYERPVDVNFLECDTTETLLELGWVPVIQWEELSNRMCEEELRGEETKLDWIEFATQRNISY
jgi:GDPmannose 4,6-dehydratase